MIRTILAISAVQHLAFLLRSGMLMVERWRPWHQITSIAHFVSFVVGRTVNATSPVSALNTLTGSPVLKDTVCA